MDKNRATTPELYRACDFLGLDYATMAPQNRMGVPEFTPGQIFAVTTVIEGKGQIVLCRFRYVGKHEWEKVEI